jgi:hypothetical protein
MFIGPFFASLKLGVSKKFSEILGGPRPPAILLGTPMTLGEAAL